MPNLISREYCTACGACLNKCPHNSIRFEADEVDNLYPKVDKLTCVECKMCEKACPQISKDNLAAPPMKAFAAWHKDFSVRKTSASGGVASAFYDFAHQEGQLCYGVTFDDKWNIKYRRISNESDRISARNSKYAFSDTNKIFKEIQNELRHDKIVLWIGLPCQTAGLKKYLVKEYKNLITVDLICHGVCSGEYLKQYIGAIESQKNQHYTQCFFRDANFDTSKFAYTLYMHTSEKPDYIEYVNNGLYSMGYHKGITYRENCYHCKYASIERVGDITLADYWLIGSKIPFLYDKNNVSLVFVNTSKGVNYLKNVVAGNLLETVERPIEEALEVQGQLRRPTMKSFEQKLFVHCYKKSQNFVKSIEKATKFRRFCNANHLNFLFNLIYRIDLKIQKIIEYGACHQW